MFDFQEKRQMRRLLYSKVTIAILFIIAFFLLMSAFERFKVERETAAKLELRKEDLKKLELRAEALRYQVDHMKNERGIEEELRSRFDVAREGEKVIILLADPKQKKTSTTSTASSTESKTKRSWFEVLKFW